MLKIGRARSGFTLVEIMITAAIIGLVALIAVPRVLSSWRKSQVARFASDLRTVAGALDSYATENGAFPADTAPGVAPPGIDVYLKRFNWALTPVGGQWDWDANTNGVVGGISVFQPQADEETLTAIDNKVDDGELGGGFFRQREDGEAYIFSLEDM